MADFKKYLIFFEKTLDKCNILLYSMDRNNKRREKMKLGNIRLVRIMRVPTCIVRPFVNFIAEVMGDNRYRNYTVGILYVTHPVDTVKWMFRWMGRI